MGGAVSSIKKTIRKPPSIKQAAPHLLGGTAYTSYGATGTLLGMGKKGGGAPGAGSTSQLSTKGAPQFLSMRDPLTGGLKSEFSYDPNKSAAFGQLREQAMSTGTSPWAQMQLQKQGMEEGGLKDLAARQSLQATGQQQAGLARVGGLGGGARALLARGGAQDLMMAKQGAARQGAQARLGIGEEDLMRRERLLGQVADTEQKAQEMNLQALRGEIPAQREFEMERYRQQMAARGAAKTAAAQEAAARAQQPKGGGILSYLGL